MLAVSRESQLIRCEEVVAHISHLLAGYAVDPPCNSFTPSVCSSAVSDLTRPHPVSASAEPIKVRSEGERFAKVCWPDGLTIVELRLCRDMSLLDLFVVLSS